jgi:hypothetical protein
MSFTLETTAFWVRFLALSTTSDPNLPVNERINTKFF